MSEPASATGPDPRDIRPVIAAPSSGNLGLWGFGLVLLIGGAVLFNALSASREGARVPATFAATDNTASRIASPPPLAVPARFLEGAGDELEPPTGEGQNAAPVRSAVPAQPVYAPSPVQSYIPPPPAVTPPAPQSRVVFEQGGPANPAGGQAGAPSSAERVTAGRFANPSRTIPKGTVIPAVLETALDSTRPGGVRALVQRDVSGFDGSRILIQRGSRLYGEYEADLQAGQKRAMIRWTRLIRPDGVTIALDSPASDPLGRAGVRGKVDSKFFQRFGGAILQSVLDIGVGIATREATNGLIVALPGSAQNVQVQQPQQIQPTLKVEHGTSVSVFVARDLDFSTVES